MSSADCQLMEWITRPNSKWAIVEVWWQEHQFVPEYCFLVLSIKRFKPLINRRQKQKTNPLAAVNGVSWGEWTRGGTAIWKARGCSSEILKKNPWYRHDWNFLSLNKTLFPVMFSAYNLKGTAGNPLVSYARQMDRKCIFKSETLNNMTSYCKMFRS